MKISIVTPNYNYGRFLKKAVASVFGQLSTESSLEVEHIVIDGGSTDKTLDILKDWEASLRQLSPEVLARYAFRWVSEPDNGQTDAINKGLRMTTGDIVCWLNADEYYLPGALGKVALAFDQYPKADFIYGEPLFVDAQDKPIRVKRDYPFSKFVLLYHDCHIASCCSFWRRKILEAGHYLDDSYKVTMDYEYWCRLVRLGFTFQFIPNVIGAFTWHEKNVSVVYDERRKEELLKVKLLYTRRLFKNPRLRVLWLRLADFVSHQYRRLLVVIRILLMKREAV